MNCADGSTDVAQCLRRARQLRVKQDTISELIEMNSESVPESTTETVGTLLSLRTGTPSSTRVDDEMRIRVDDVKPIIGNKIQAASEGRYPRNVGSAKLRRNVAERVFVESSDVMNKSNPTLTRASPANQ